MQGTGNTFILKNIYTVPQMRFQSHYQVPISNHQQYEPDQANEIKSSFFFIRPFPKISQTGFNQPVTLKQKKKTTIPRQLSRFHSFFPYLWDAFHQAVMYTKRIHFEQSPPKNDG